MSINRNLATFAKDVQTDGSLKGIAVTVTVAGGKFVIDGTSQQDMFIPKGVKYRFDVSDSSNSNHPLRFSTTSDGTHGSGSAYTTGITTSGTAGSSGAYVEVQLQQDAPDQLYYYCGNHSGMGAGAETAPVAVSSYGDSNVDTHLNTSGASSGQILGWNGSDYAWVADSNTGIGELSDDTSPQLGGDLDVVNRSIVSTSNQNINITPNGSGKVVIDGISHPNADGNSGQVLSTDGSGNLSFASVGSLAGSGIQNVSDDTSPQLGANLDVVTHSIVSTSNRDINITPDGSGKVVLDGLSYPQADGSADQVLKTDGSGNLSFVDQSTGGGGGTLTATASGALSDGSTVAINADGTVSIIAEAQTENVGALGMIDTAQYTNDGTAVYHEAEQKVVVFYADRLNNSYYLTGIVGTVSGETISFTGETVLHSANSKQIAAVYDPDAEKIVVAFGDWSDTGKGKSFVVSLSGTTLSKGSTTTFDSDQYCYMNSLAYDTANNKVLLAYRPSDDNDAYARVGTVSGTGISWGSRTTFSDGNAFHTRIVYDSSSGKAVVTYRHDEQSNFGRAKVGTISGTSISFGSHTNYSTVGSEAGNLIYFPTANKIVVVFDDTNDSNKLKANVGTVSGTSITFAGSQTISTSKQNDMRVIYDPDADCINVLAYDDTTSRPKIWRGTFSGSTLSFNSGTELTSYYARFGLEPMAYDSTNKRVIISFQDKGSDSSYDLEALVFRNAKAGGATLTAENFVGISDAAYASGATATIQTAGSVDDAQSGLTAGQTYYVQAATGALSTTPDTISVVAGTAISATKLLINPDSDPTVTSYTNSDVDSHLNVSGASSGQVLSWNGSDYAWANDATGTVGTMTATASGALSDGSTVAINADGTVSIIKAAVSQSIGTAAQYDTGTSGTENALFGKAAYDTNSNRVVVAYRNATDSGHGYAVVGTVSGSSISWGTPVEFRGAGVDHIAISFDSSANKVLIIYRDYGNSYHGYAVVGTVSNTAISFGSVTNFEAGGSQYMDIAFDTNVNKHLIVYQDYHDNSYGKGIVATISGTSVSFGTAVTFVTNEANYNTVTYDSTAQKFLVSWCKATSAAEAAVATISGTSVSFGSTATVASGYFQWMSSAYDSGASKHIVAYAGTGSPYNGNVKVGTISGTSVSFGSAAVVDTNTASTYYFALSYNAASNKTLFVYNKGGNTGSGYYNIGTVSGTSISFGTSAAFEDGHVVSGNDVIYDPTTEKNILLFSDMDDNAKGKYIVFTQALAGGATLTSENFIGISNGAYASGATATIQTSGSIDDAQSGLTAGQTYYVQASTGALALTPDTISVVAGTAISATKLLINPDSDPTITTYTDSDVNSHLNVSSASANQVLSYNGSDYAWTDDNTSPSMTATASGTLANGDMVIVNSDGTVSAIGTQSVSEAIGSETIFNTGTSGSRYMASVSDPTSGKIVLFYQDQSNSEYGTAVVGTISGTTVSFGTPSVFNSGATSWISAAYHTAESSIVCFYMDEANSSNVNAVIATVSGTSVSFGSEQTVGKGPYSDVAYDTVNGKFLLCYRDNDDGSNYRITSRVISISSGTLSAGTKNPISNDSGSMYPRPVYDANAQKFLISYRGSSQHGKCRVATISGTSVSYGTETTFNNASTAYLDSTYDASAQKVVIAFSDDGLSGKARLIAGTISGTSVSFGSEQALNNADINRIRIDYDANAETVVAVYEKNIGSSMVANRITLSGTTFTVGAEFTLNSGTSDYPYIAYDSNSKRMIAAYRDDANSNQGTAVIIQNAFSVTKSLTSENFIGVSNAAYADGDTATVQVLGATDDAQSGLTAGQKYFVQSDGSIGLSPDTISVAAGTAISATQLLICPEFSAEDKTSPSTQLVASGTLANGTKVCVNADGTVSAIEETTASEAIGSETVYNSGSTVLPDAAYDVNSGKVVVVYRDSADSSKGKAIVGTVSGTSISFGSEVTFHNSAISSPCIAYEANAQKVVIAYHDNSVGKAIVGTVSGTSISFGSAVTWNNAESDYNHISYDSVNQKVVVVCRSTNTTYGTAAVGTVSGTSISFGSTVTFHSGSALYISSAFDVNSGKHVIVWRDGSNSNYGTAKVGTVSGTSISFGSAVVFHSGTTSYMDIAYDASAQKVVIAYNDGSNSNKGAAVVGTVSGTSISFGNEVVFNSSTSFYHGISYHSAAQKVVVGYSNGTATRGELIVGTVSGTSISFGSATTFNNADTNYVLNTYDESAQKIVTVYSDGGNSSHGTAIVFTPAYTSQNLTATNYIGISDAAYTNGQTATIQVAGATDDAQSGLTAGQLYYVQNDGTLSTTADSPSVVAGTALSATKLIVKG